MLRPTDGVLAYRLLKYRVIPWLPAYRRDRSTKRGMASPTDLIVCITDHYEPPKSDGERAHERVRDWVDAYRQATAAIVDSDGGKPKHTWFYRFDFLDERCVRELALASWEGLGEIEFHLHHGNDDQQRFRQRLRAGLALGTRYGAMLGAGGLPSFGYIAGDWALNNGAGNDELSGCSDEISVLRAEGCFGDFTFPALASKAQPRRVNAIYYAPPGEGRKAYESGPDAAVGLAPPADGFLMVQGPTVIDRSEGTIEYAAIESFAKFHSGRIAAWVRAGIGVRGRPEWRIVKLHTHGIQSHPEYRGKAVADLYTGLLDYAAAHGMRVHFVTARELVNIIRAAEQGMSGDAGRYRNYSLLAPPNTVIRCDVPVRVEVYDARQLCASLQRPAAALAVRLAGRVIKCGADGIEAVELRTGENPSLLVRGRGAGIWSADDGPGQPLQFQSGSVRLDLGGGT